MVAYVPFSCRQVIVDATALVRHPTDSKGALRGHGCQLPAPAADQPRRQEDAVELFPAHVRLAVNSPNPRMHVEEVISGQGSLYAADDAHLAP